MTTVGGTTNTQESKSRNMMNICTTYGFDFLIISGSYGGHRQHTTYDGQQPTHDGRRTTPWVWHKLTIGELNIAKTNLTRPTGLMLTS